ncbi:lamin tail domain-containing protein [Streptacidiphilus sp. ASG 303]|uniref:lamin tail domain-containing protein n=1 Tax=Streptacidiphilus sp. ASG 303 TaxID=2896847 RepID=UPI001E41C8B7|nr:lamin tail domain-containing protein [Streptacidiphilus sp. ASG 303]MCD0483396.1 lamin tail domain-containing protein [Streptacidiphilus sp. ASG 303]
MRPRRIPAVAAAAALGTAALLTAAPAQAAGSVHLTKIYYDSPGRDTRSNASLDAEYVQIRNSTSRPVSLRGWTLTDASRHAYVFPAFTLRAGATVTVHTGQGRNSAAHLYQQRRAYVWNNDRDRATLRRSSGAVQDTCSYANADRDWTSC